MSDRLHSKREEGEADYVLVSLPVSSINLIVARIIFLLSLVDNYEVVTSLWRWTLWVWHSNRKWLVDSGEELKAHQSEVVSRKLWRRLACDVTMHSSQHLIETSSELQDWNSCPMLFHAFIVSRENCFGILMSWNIYSGRRVWFLLCTGYHLKL